MPVFLGARVNVTPSGRDSFVDVDISASVPSDAVAGIFLLRETTGSTSGTYDCGWRRKGDTLADYISTTGASEQWLIVALDASRICQFYLSSGSPRTWVLYLIGYFRSFESSFFNEIDKSPGSIGSWQDIDCSAQISEPAIAAVFRLKSYTIYGSGRITGMRAMGSSDGTTAEAACQATEIVALDSNKKCQAYRQDSWQHFMLLGYIRKGVVMDANPVDVTPSSSGAWTDLTALPSGALAGIYRISKTYPDAQYGLRSKGDSEATLFYVAGLRCAGLLQPDASGIVQGYKSTSGVVISRLGYFVDTKHTMLLQAQHALLAPEHRSLLLQAQHLLDATAIVTPTITAVHYTLTLTGADDELPDLALPMSSFQARRKNGEATYLSCVVPAVAAFADGIAARPNGEMVVMRGDRYTDGSTVLSEIARANLEEVRYDAGALRNTGTLTGHKTITYGSPATVALTGVTYRAVYGGKRHLRGAMSNALKPGDTAVWGSDSLVVGEIAYTVGPTTAVMEVAEA